MGQPAFSSDIYALGIVGIQAVTGRAPTTTKDTKMGEVIWRDYAQVSDEVAAILNKMVTLIPAKVPLSCRGSSDVAAFVKTPSNKIVNKPCT